ncbi:MAG: hypothetical protein QG670_180 [Thermoproteota archaeon]|nr:hypothetical protein [Thermoproteota archaeon]
MAERNLSVCLFLIVVFTFPILSFTDVQGQSSEFFISGQALDYVTNDYLRNASVSIWHSSNRGSSVTWNFIKEVKTDLNGKFSVKVQSGFQYRVYSYNLNSESKALDYAPSFEDFFLIENVTLFFRLIPAASIVFDGSLWFVESSKPSTQYSFIIVDNSASRLNNGSFVNIYGASSHNFLGLPLNRILVPVDRNITIIVNATVIVGTAAVFRSFTINDLKHLNMTKGRTVSTDIRKYSSQANLDIVYGRLSVSEQLIEKLELQDFYVVAERQDLSKVRKLLMSAQTKYDNRQYDECYSNIREGYLNVVTTIQRLEDIYANATSSVIFLTFFLAFTALAVSYLLSKRLLIRGLMSIPFFGILFLLFYLTYPGCRVVPWSLLIPVAAASLGIVTIITPLFSALVGERIVSIMSLAKLNLGRRRLRFILTLMSTIVLVMSFVSLTSFSAGYGLTTKPFYTLSANPKGVLMKQFILPEYRSAIGFYALDSSTLNLLNERVNIITVAPKAETLPATVSFMSLSPIGNPSITARIFGILGIKASVESQVTHIERIVVQGRYLIDGENDTGLISVLMARDLGVKVGENIILNVGATPKKEMKIVGLFDDGLFSSLRDIDGELLIPKKKVMFEGMDPVLRPCESYETIITTWHNALELPTVALSRIDILTEDSKSDSSIARDIALEQGFDVYYSTGSQNYEIVVSTYLETKGLAILIPWVIVIISMIITVLNSIFEQQREIAILSSVGLNPSHLAGLFISEALIIGIVGGGIGYLLGLGSYKLMAFFSIIVEVRSKVSAAWSIAAVSVSLAAVLVGALIALRYSVVITPSLMRRWQKEENAPSIGKSWVFQMPIRLQEADLDPMFKYVISRFQKRLQAVSIDLNPEDFRLTLSDEENAGIKTKTFKFSCIPRQRITIGGVSFNLVASKGKDDDAYSLMVVFGMGKDNAVYKTADFLRMEIIGWNTLKRK